MAGTKKERRVFNVARITVDKDNRVKAPEGQYTFDNSNGVPAALKGIAFPIARTIAEARFESDAARDVAALAQYNLGQQQTTKRAYLSDAALEHFEAGRNAEGIAVGRQVWDTFVFRVGHATRGEGKVKVSRSELAGLKDAAAKLAAMEAELAALKAGRKSK